MNKLKIIALLAILCFFSECKHESVSPEIDLCNLPDTVSFSKNLLPLFTGSCALSGCHSGSNPQGGLTLEHDTAYKSLLRKGSGFVDITDPKSSLLYVRLNTASPTTMPATGKLNDCTIKIILKWITQGAKNN